MGKKFVIEEVEENSGPGFGAVCCCVIIIAIALMAAMGR
jgi:hypothetical protein